MRFNVDLQLDALTAPEVDAVINGLLAPLFFYNMTFLRRYGAEVPDLYASGVRYQAEPFGEENWQDIPHTLAAGFGDCEDLACWRAAELRVRRGVNASPVVIRQPAPQPGVNLIHIAVRLPGGAIDDPSRVLGMETGAAWRTVSAA